MIVEVQWTDLWTRVQIPSSPLRNKPRNIRIDEDSLVSRLIHSKFYLVNLSIVVAISVFCHALVQGPLFALYMLQKLILSYLL